MFRQWWLKYSCFRYGVFGGTGIGGDNKFGGIYVPVTLAAGDLAFDGNDGL